MSAGVPAGTLEHVIVCPPNDIKAVELAFEAGDVAAIILEPAGGSRRDHPDDPWIPGRSCGPSPASTAWC